MKKEIFRTNELNSLPCATSCLFHRTCIENFDKGTCLLKLNEFIESIERNYNATLTKGSVTNDGAIFESEDKKLKVTIKNGFSDIERKQDINDKLHPI